MLGDKYFIFGNYNKVIEVYLEVLEFRKKYFSEYYFIGKSLYRIV